jgi:hypothetical protein
LDLIGAVAPAKESRIIDIEEERRSSLIASWTKAIAR